MAFYPYFLLALSSMGMASNVVSLFFFARQRFRRNFHRLLVILAIYDFMVRSFKSNIYILFHILQFKCKITDTLFFQSIIWQLVQGNSHSSKTPPHLHRGVLAQLQRNIQYYGLVFFQRKLERNDTGMYSCAGFLESDARATEALKNESLDKL